MRSVLVVLVALVALASPATALFNQPKPFALDLTFSDGLAPTEPVVVVSGKLEAELPDVEGNFGFFGAQDAEVTGIVRACWGQSPSACATGTLSARVHDGHDFGLGYPEASDAAFTADHAIGIFVDFESNEDLNSLDIRHSLMAPSVGSSVDFNLAPLPDALVLNEGNAGALVGLADASRIDLLRGTEVVHTIVGKSETLLFTGAPRMAPFAVDSAVLPFEDGSTSHWTKASRDDAEAGLELGRVQELLLALEDSNAGSSQSDGAEQAEPDLGAFGAVLDRVMNGAILRMPAQEPGEQTTEEQFAFIRFTKLDVEGEGTDLAWSGKAMLDLRDGDVAGASRLFGFSYVQFPWWSWLLWVVGIGLWIGAVATRTERRNAKWDRLRWIGWAATAAVSILVFILWDIETNDVWGVSLLTGGTKAFLVALLVELVPLAMIMAATAAPLRLILRNSARFAGQGRFMGLPGPVATLIGFLLGVYLLRSYLDLIAGQVIQSLG